jgi:ribonuclease P protein component
VLAAAHRLRRSSEFAAAVRGGRRAGRGAVVVHLNMPELTDTDRTTEPAPGRGPEGTETRAGFIVSRAVGGAVVRNKVRRRLRHLVAERLDRLPPAGTLVVRALPVAAASSYRELGADLDAAIEAARAPRPPRASRRRA